MMRLWQSRHQIPFTNYLEAIQGWDVVTGEPLSKEERAERLSSAINQSMDAWTAAAMMGGVVEVSSGSPWGSNSAVRLDTIDDIVKYGKHLGKDGQLFLTNKEALQGLDLTSVSDLAKAETILGLPAGRLTNASGVVLTEIDVRGLNVRLPTHGNQYFIPGGFTSGGVPEIVIDSINVFADPAVQLIRFFFRK